MMTIKEFENKTAAVKAVKAEKRKKRTQNKVKKRINALSEVVNMVMQEMLTCNTPAEQVTYRIPSYSPSPHPLIHPQVFRQ